MTVDARQWLEHMRRGDFAAAWTISEQVLRARGGTPCTHLPRHTQWIWDGRPLDDARVLVRCYHGLGDTIQFIRYAPLVKSRAREVIVCAQPRLLNVLAGVRGIDRLLPLHDGAPQVDYDVDAESMELPFIFRSTLATLPAVIPYIDLQREPLDRSRGPAIGIVWKAGDWDDRRSIPFALLERVMALPATWYILQGEPGLSERRSPVGIVRGTDSLDEAARVIGGLDLLITIDSMPAHLGGALGVPVWTLLPFDADWRWMSDRDDSPWYPTMRLFRQTCAGDWSDVIARVERALQELVAAAASHRDRGGLGLRSGFASRETNRR